ncbi:hypothetical protein [Prevotellamassilia timonensis]|uniref:hypothetical protein n=1 Tax=Prevotellamassilia timonensis TaxID=1852370 RepID=UPI0008D9D321|nr:hypothetical protein [Prevotellamassilia timonensis]
MKKYFISGAMLAGLMSLAACSNDEGVVADNNGAEQQFTITLASSGDRATRAAADRTLESEAAGQSIEKVTLVVRSQDDNKVVYTYTLDNWNGTAATDYDTNGHGKKLTFTIPKADKLGEGKYVVTAVGYNEGNYNLSLPAKGDVLDKNITATTPTGAEAKEVFAGEKKFNVTADKKIEGTDASKPIQSVDVTLHRQVAGAYGYFTSIPAKIGDTDVASIRMVSRSKNTVLTFGSFNSSFTTTDAKVMYMVNGSVPAGKTAKFLNGDEANVLFSAKITDWFPGGDENNDGVYDKKDTNWTKHYSGSYLKGSVFASNFIVPFSATEGKSTLELQLLDATGNVLYAWPVKLDASNDQIGKTGETASANLSDPSTTMGFAETADVFSLFRNHIYSIGIHKQSTSTTDPETPVPGTDQPTDLSKIQNVVIRVNDNWEALHHMSIDE